jgi:hypothetical protein
MSCVSAVSFLLIVSNSKIPVPAQLVKCPVDE